MAEEKNEDLEISESADGSAVVNLPDDIQSPDEQEQPEAQEASSDNDTGDDSLDDNDNDTEAIREAKRQKRRSRKEYHRQVQQEKDTRLQMLQRQNQELMERLSVVERKTQGSEMARLDKAIEDQEARILFAKQKIKEATETGNGDLLTSAQEMWFEARRNTETLSNLKKRAVAPAAKQAIQAPDPMVQRHANEWMSQNSWYDPSGRDPDSKVALTVDQQMAEDGWSPDSAEYWEELDIRLQKYLPHRYNENSSEEVRRPKRHRSVVTSTGRESLPSGKNTFTLTPDQVRAMKDAGFWDDPDKRSSMIKRYAQEARQQRN
jgi:hypothetical protein